MSTRVTRSPPKIVRTRNFKRFNQKDFVQDIEQAPWSVCSAFDSPDDSYWAWLQIFTDISIKHAPYRDVKLRRVSLPWINAKIKHMMNLRLKLLRNAKQTNNPATWTNYRRLRNQITADIREAKCQYYQKLFDEVHD